jgi:D-alanyl-D-alanine carboxypeptidase (penicillin-binding protein 5/6)
MARTAGERVARSVGVTLMILGILAVALYAPATLLGPVPATQPAITSVADIAPTVGAPTLPEDGASAVITADGDSLLAAAGNPEAVPLGGAAKIITALVVLDAKPLKAGEPGPNIIIGNEDFAFFTKYIADSDRAVSLIQGETWTEKSFLQALLLGSSNNHADSLARWAFGSVDAYVIAANAWLQKNGYAQTEVVDATGLSEFTVGTASDLAKLTQTAFGNPVIAETITLKEAVLPGNRRVTNEASHRPEDGIAGLSLSYTDSAGLTFLFQVAIPSSDKPVPLIGAFLRQPDWETLDAGLSTVIETATAGLADTTVVAAGDAFVGYSTPWGEEIRGVAAETVTQREWLTTPISHTVEAQPITVPGKGDSVGTVVFSTPTGDVSVELITDKRANDPGLVWRLTNPVPVIGEFARSLGWLG